ncbi:ATP-binding cassette domain-containing protein [Oceanispirochaeta crateris]|nr:ATP-binding cassette domain-containing protein [Oceanispirochaeta crateris]
MPNSVEFKNVFYRYDEQSEPVLKDISFNLEQGSFNILVGPGGSGKSTLCDLFNGRTPQLMGGILEGTVLIEGKATADTQMKDLACKVGYVFQNPESMFATLSVEDEIAFGPENLLFEKEEIHQSVEELLDMAGIKEYRHNLVWNLSGGQIQKLGLAAVLAMKPRLIILDEPTANLDPAATRQVHELILKLRNEGITILLVTRELDDFIAEAVKAAHSIRGRTTGSGLAHRFKLWQRYVFTILVNGIRKAEVTADALECRAFGYKEKRTYLKDVYFKKTDLFLPLLTGFILIFLIVMEHQCWRALLGL